MTEAGDFISRWSRLKRGPAKNARSIPAGAPSLPNAIGRNRRTETATLESDSTGLPAIDTIIGDTDVRPFLRSGVPPELAQAALRRAWVSDPAIRDFIGIAENQWDFAAAAGIPGFGPLRENDDAAGLLALALGTLAGGAETPPVQETPAAVNPRPETGVSHPAQEGSDGGEAPVDGCRPGRRRGAHGSALPR